MFVTINKKFVKTNKKCLSIIPDDPRRPDAAGHASLDCEVCPLDAVLDPLVPGLGGVLVKVVLPVPDLALPHKHLGGGEPVDRVGERVLADVFKLEVLDQAVRLVAGQRVLDKLAQVLDDLPLVLLDVLVAEEHDVVLVPLAPAAQDVGKVGAEYLDAVLVHVEEVGLGALQKGVIQRRNKYIIIIIIIIIL